MLRRTLTLLTATTAAIVLAAGPAAATHTHGRVLPSGACVLLAANGGEDEVDLPNADGDYAENRRHPLHVNVHLGVPGTQATPDTIFVAIGDDGAYTADAMERCDGEFVNG
jgi:hypothetical protein